MSTASTLTASQVNQGMTQQDTNKIVGYDHRIWGLVFAALPIGNILFWMILARSSSASSQHDAFVFAMVIELFLLPFTIQALVHFKYSGQQNFLRRKLLSGEITPSFYFPAKLVAGNKFIIDDKAQRLHLGKISYPMSSLKRIEKVGPEVLNGEIRLYLNQGDKTILEVQVCKDLRNQYTRLVNHLYGAGYWRR